MAPAYDFIKNSLWGPSSSLSSVARGTRDFGGLRLVSTQAAVEASTSDGLTVDGILSNQWMILDASEGDWKSHATAIAQSINLIKKRLQVGKCSDVYLFERSGSTQKQSDLIPSLAR